MTDVVLALLLLAGQPSESGSVTRELTQIVRQLATAWKNGDCEEWGVHIAPEWSVIHVTGAVITREQALQMCQRPPVAIASMTSDELAVRSFGDAAVVTGRTTATTGGANSVTVTLRFTDVFIRRGGRWQAVASHVTQLGP